VASAPQSRENNRHSIIRMIGGQEIEQGIGGKMRNERKEKRLRIRQKFSFLV